MVLREKGSVYINERHNLAKKSSLWWVLGEEELVVATKNLYPISIIVYTRDA